MSQYLNKPIDLHMTTVHRVLRYIKFSIGQCLFFFVASNFYLKAYSDADWAGCLDTRKSTTDYYVFLGDTLIF